MRLECLVSNPLRKQMFHQDYIDLRSLIITYVYESFFKSWCFQEALYLNLKYLSWEASINWFLLRNTCIMLNHCHAINIHTEKYSIQCKFWLQSRFSDWFGTKWNSVRCWISRNIVIGIRFARLGKHFSACRGENASTSRSGNVNIYTGKKHIRCPSDWRLSAYWGTNWGPLYTPQYHSAVLIEDSSRTAVRLIAVVFQSGHSGIGIRLAKLRSHLRRPWDNDKIM